MIYKIFFKPQPPIVLVRHSHECLVAGDVVYHNGRINTLVAKRPNGGTLDYRPMSDEQEEAFFNKVLDAQIEEAQQFNDDIMMNAEVM